MATIWLDYSGARPDPRDMARLGVKGVLRYLSEPIPATSWKRISVAEKDAILAAGLDLILVYEWYEGRMLEGYNAGHHDGQAALVQAKELGYPAGASIYFAHDTSAINDNAVLDYMRGVHAALDGYYRADIYSGIHVVELVLSNGLATYGWQTLAWSKGQVGKAHIYQNGKHWYGAGCDENVILHEGTGSWRSHGTAPVQPVPVQPAPAPNPKPTPPPKPAPAPAVGKYKVVSGDNLTFIAQRFHTTVSELVKLNPSLASKPNLIRVGQVLDVPGGSPNNGGGAKPVVHVKQYRVTAGDSLSMIAKRYGTTVRQLVAWNKSLIRNPNLIRVGWVLRVG